MIISTFNSYCILNPKFDKLVGFVHNKTGNWSWNHNFIWILGCESWLVAWLECFVWEVENVDNNKFFFKKKNWLLAYCSLTTLLSDSECSSDFTWNWKQQAVLGRECPQIQSCRTHSMNRTPLASSTPWEGSAHRHYHEQPEFCCILFTRY